MLVLTGLFPLRTRFTCYGHQTGDWKIDQFPHGNHCFNSYENAFPGKNKKAAFFYRGGLSDIWNKFVIT